MLKGIMDFYEFLTSRTLALLSSLGLSELLKTSGWIKGPLTIRLTTWNIAQSLECTEKRVVCIIAYTFTVWTEQKWVVKGRGGGGGGEWGR
jgi:hypothetical protein